MTCGTCAALGQCVSPPSTRPRPARSLRNSQDARQAGAARLPHPTDTRCGHPGCACHADPPRRHGPYWQWTRKVAAKTICRWLSPEQHHDYQTWINNDRRLHELIGQLETLGAAALEADPRLHRHGRSQAGRTS